MQEMFTLLLHKDPIELTGKRFDEYESKPH